MDRDVMWAPLRWPGLEHLTIRGTDDEIVADGLVLGRIDGRPLRIAYRLHCDRSWRARELRLEIVGDARAIVLSSHRAGDWRDGSGQSVPELAGATDIDISVTPFTNTLPIRRLGLHPGESQPVRAAYVDATALTVRLVDQRYTCLEAGVLGGRYRYESAQFAADLTVDADGLVVEYPGAWQRADRPIPAVAAHAFQETKQEE